MKQNESFPGGSRKRFYIFYTAVFLAVSAFVFCWYYINGRTLIWQGDGWHQHYKALMYYGQYLRKIVSNLVVHHKIVIPDWDFSIGEGSDILSALHYYVIGDPLALLSAFVPAGGTVYLFCFLSLLRLYLAGISFSVLCFGMGKRSYYGILAGAVTYSFCLWGIYNAARHPYFLNPMIWFPLIILGAERIIRRERSAGFIAAVCLAAASNFYFFYMIAVLTAAYVVIRSVWLYHSRPGELFKAVLRVTAAAAIGAMMAGILLVPVLRAFLGDSRMGVSHRIRLFYPLPYYCKIPAALLVSGGDYWLLIGLSSTALAAAALHFLRRDREEGRRFTRCLFIVCSVMLLFPVFGSALNGFSYVSNRWSWAFVLLCSYILADRWEDLLKVTAQERKKLFLGAGILFLVSWLSDRSLTAAVFSGIILLSAAIAAGEIFRDEKRRERLQRALLLITALSVINISFWLNGPKSRDYVSDMIEIEKAEQDLAGNEIDLLTDLENEEAAEGAGNSAVSENTEDTGIVRYAGRGVSRNGGVMKDLSSTDYYWSISNPFINRFRTDMELVDDRFSAYDGYDERTQLLTLASVKYFIVPASDRGTVPYGFEQAASENIRESVTDQLLAKLREELGTETLTADQEKKVRALSDKTYKVYRNPFAMPLGYCYSSYVPEEDWNSLSALQKQELMMDSVVLSEPSDCVPAYRKELPADRTLPCTVECRGPEITFDGSRVVTTAKNTSMTLTFESAGYSELYLEVKGLSFEETPECDLYLGGDDVDPLKLYNRTNWEQMNRNYRTKSRIDRLYWTPSDDVSIEITASTGTKNVLKYRTEEESFYSGRHDYIVNLGYNSRKKPAQSVTLTFPARGVYTIGGLSVQEVPLERYKAKARQRRKNHLEQVEIGTDRVRGEITLEKPALLCVTIPYSEGWHAEVDGKDAKIRIANERYLGIDLPPGEHRITLTYTTPYKKTGACVSLAGWVLFIVYLYIFNRGAKKVWKVEERQE